MEQEIVNKGGEQWLIFSTYVGPKGMHVHVKVHPKVEQFMQALGDGKVRSSVAYDTRWFSLKEGEELSIYNMSSTIRSSVYTLAKPSQTLWDTENPETGSRHPDGGIINLSFLRLKGISNPEGIEFGIKDIYPLSFRRELKEKVGSAFRQLVMDHIRPVRVTLIVSGQEY